MVRHSSRLRHSTHYAASRIESDLDLRFYGNKNTARLAELINQAPALQYLFLSDLHDVLACLPPFPPLETLRLNRSHFHSHHVKSIRTAAIPCIPNLTHLILHTTESSGIHLSCWRPSPRPRIRLRAPGRFLVEPDAAPRIVLPRTRGALVLSRCSRDIRTCGLHVPNFAQGTIESQSRGMTCIQTRVEGPV
jgi:hypothetical protein